MSIATRPCSFCGAAVLLSATDCGSCGRALPPVPQGRAETTASPAPGSPTAAPRPGGPPAPARTVFGYAAPKLPLPHRGAAPPGGGAAAGAASSQPPAASAAGAGGPGMMPGGPGMMPGGPGMMPGGPGPATSAPGAAPAPGSAPTVLVAVAPQAAPGAAPGWIPGPGGGAGGPVSAPPSPAAAAGQFSGEAAGGGPGGAPAGQPGGGHAAPWGGVPGASAAPGGGAPAPTLGVPAPGGFAPGMPTAGEPPAGMTPPFSGPPPVATHGLPQWPGAATGLAPATGSDPLARLATRLPVSPPGTLFGLPLAPLRHPASLRRALTAAGGLLLGTVLLPLHTGPTVWVWDVQAKFRILVWPVLAALAYLLVAVGPPRLRALIPPALLGPLPFAVAFLSIGITGLGMAGLMVLMAGALGWSPDLPGSVLLMTWGYPLLVLGLVARLLDPEDPTTRWIIGLGAVLVMPHAVSFLFDGALTFAGKQFLHVLHDLLAAVVYLLASACLAFVPGPQQVPQLRSVGAFAPLIVTVLVAWLPLEIAIVMFGTAGTSLGGGMWIGLRLLASTLAHFGVLLLTAPSVHEELRRLLAVRSTLPSAWGTPHAPPEQPAPGHDMSSTPVSPPAPHAAPGQWPGSPGAGPPRDPGAGQG